MTLVLIIDDVAPMAEQYAYDLARIGGFGTVTAGSGASALEMIEREPVDCIILDLEMPGMDGFDVLRILHQRGSQIPVIVYTGTGNFDRCVQALRLGAYTFIDKAEPMERVVREVENAIERQRLMGEVMSLRKQVAPDSPLMGSSAPMRRLKDAIARVAPIPSPVLIHGESGTGKELVARELHRLGPAPEEPFTAVNSAALPEQLVESELFGHERGAFTGAQTLRKGAFEATGKGTLLLDEVGELPPPVQAKLLRVLEQRQVTRVGGQRTIPVEARVIAATHRDLGTMVKEGSFREDLYYRLNVHLLEVPPLRDRRSDLPDIARHLIEEICRRFGIPPRTLDRRTVDLLMAYDWRRNNVRELRNILERMVISTDAESIGPGAVPAEIRKNESSHRKESNATTFQEQKAEAERSIVMRALDQHEWHITRTAEALGLADHASLLKIMRRHGIRKQGMGNGE